MAVANKLDGPRAAPASGGAAEYLVVMLHGLGADGNDLFGLAPILAQAFPSAAFVAPNAPEPCDMAPMGHQWFSLADRDPEKILSGVRAAAPILDDFLDEELKNHGLTDDKLVLLGFSQGTMMALHVATRRPNSCAAVIGYSGALIAPGYLDDELKSEPRVLLIHGEDDDVVPPQALGAAEKALMGHGLTVYSQMIPGLAHGIDENGLRMGIGFLMETFALAGDEGES
ncbi:alpha/beta hydrolase [Denitrobaculum tricleocarpae]|uniref:Alpha/beta fold hydrolase n=1 Tax=Denitrobaculum tricleocarpae TaxID=2591009 RepID=A0A545U1R6_9PROT|nr:alpha/beta fold hydrolase [Denitrobaculum tricleocarpae]TQV83420.1 alpha/beta fold hydrolase [Denitrobaculum tricleocarpae]